ncbi:hypothetical protein J6T21_02660 [Candidatus Saccharibacteria bacterium]|nr:hypothetical protein [Candidatus Saccharibacteria bacterium]
MKNLVLKIRDAIREKAKEVEKFKKGNGAIRILFYPLCTEADQPLGGMSSYSDNTNDIVDYEYTFAIAPGGSRKITGVWDGLEQMVDCYAFSALKIAHCSRVQDLGLGLRSGIDIGIPDAKEDNGYGPYPGAICFEVKKNDRPYLYLFVCVSGADSEDDLKCALVATNVVSEYFSHDANFKVINP